MDSIDQLFAACGIGTPAKTYTRSFIYKSCFSNSFAGYFWRYRVKLFLSILGQLIEVKFGHKMNKIRPLIREILDSIKGTRRG